MRLEGEYSVTKEDCTYGQTLEGSLGEKGSRTQKENRTVPRVVNALVREMTRWLPFSEENKDELNRGLIGKGSKREVR